MDKNRNTTLFCTQKTTSCLRSHPCQILCVKGLCEVSNDKCPSSKNVLFEQPSTSFQCVLKVNLKLYSSILYFKHEMPHNFHINNLFKTFQVKTKFYLLFGQFLTVVAMADAANKVTAIVKQIKLFMFVCVVMFI